MDSQSKTNRFLMQATLGADAELQQQVARQGISDWLEQQLNMAPLASDLFQNSTENIWHYFRTRLKNEYGEQAINGEGNNPALPYKWYFHMAWWQHALSDNNDYLRQRVAQALSEILVISDNSVLELDAVGMGSYYDLLYRHAFGSYADLLQDVSMHPCMGVYLSHMNNRKANPAENIHPDENYAREIMQLFSIGLYELNSDGSRKKDKQGRDIPTYDNRDIKQLARVFTGLKAHSYQYEWRTSFWQPEYNGYQVGFNDGIDKTYKTVPFVNMTQAMKVDESYHDRGSKTLLKGHIKLPAGRSGEQEIAAVVKRLVAHPSTAPFIARHLINQLVTSNPSLEYIKAVAKQFGPEGNLKKAVREILTFPLKNPVAVKRFSSARKEDNTLVQSQKMKSPLMRVTQLLRAFKVSNNSGKKWLCGDDIQAMLTMHPLSAPTVFNFYKPDFVPHGALADANLVAPEFELHTSATSIAYVNLMYYWFFGNYWPAVSTVINQTAGIHNVPELDPEVLKNYRNDKLKGDFRRYIAMAEEVSQQDEMIDELALLLTGRSQPALKQRIQNAIRLYRNKPEWVVQTSVFMLAISPEFVIQEA